MVLTRGTSLSGHKACPVGSNLQSEQRALRRYRRELNCEELRSTGQNDCSS